ncbi:hypothetical protein NMG60_11021855 [Bertholletia excelsa]
MKSQYFVPPIRMIHHLIHLTWLKYWEMKCQTTSPVLSSSMVVFSSLLAGNFFTILVLLKTCTFQVVAATGMSRGANCNVKEKSDGDLPSYAPDMAANANEFFFFFFFFLGKPLNKSTYTFTCKL